VTTSKPFATFVKSNKLKEMRKLILGMTVTADGFVCGPNHETDWFMRTRDALVKNWIEKSLWEAGVHIMGRRTFEVIAPHWASSSDQLAEPMNKIPKVVFSKNGFVARASYGDGQTISPHASTWTNAVVAADIVSEITKLKQQEGKPVLAHGGAGFAQELVKHGLVDEYRLRIHPVVIGKGISLFALAPHLIDLHLVSSTPFESGIVVNVYTVKNS
jgi:dihydrofolate reductase